MDARAAPQLDFDANKVRAFIARYLGIDAERVTDEAHFRNDFGLDPLDQLELSILIEKDLWRRIFGRRCGSDRSRRRSLLRDLYAQAFSAA